MASSMKELEEQGQDLTTYSICLECYDEGLLKPKLLPCSHNFCLKCLKVQNYPSTHPVLFSKVITLCYSQVMLKDKTTLKCPMCNAIHTVSEGADGLLTNQFALHIINLNKSKVKEVFAEALASGVDSHCWDLLGPSHSCYNLAISPDETLFVVGGLDKELLLWRTEQLFGEENKLTKPKFMKNTEAILCVAISSANDRIFCGGYSSALVYNIHRYFPFKSLCILNAWFNVYFLSCWVYTGTS